ncbi:LamG-like jellyroll fold domain-containing protein [Flavobacterium urumqiense]|uniref:Por secretion system C-terminal sorting domain-containing protein n=1 Tax=Flavobacterium urumqiense TaxID=935224 RepID=A0A1H5ZZS8_9FLAO|nr:LamG-like jellyroll fold domain-containing protein [Flavobacterium urumqiense]SEG41602.1 Por secretion system C-terminal sorting domain-containing protein [Flavobacterium urumqiense]
MKKLYSKTINYKFYVAFSILFFVLSFQIKAQQAPTSPQVNFTQRTAAATPARTVYNVKGDFTMLGNTNLTLVNYGITTNNEGNAMKYVDIDDDSNTLNSSKANLELSNSGENGANPTCSTVLFAGLYWTGKSNDADAFTVSKQVQNGTQPVNDNSAVTHNQNIANTSYNLKVTTGGPGNNHYPIYTFAGSNTYVFNYTNTPTITVTVGGTTTNLPATISTSGSIATATLTTPYSITDGTVTIKIYTLTRSTAIVNGTDYTINSSISVNVSGTVATYTTLTKNYDKKVISIKGPGATTYTSITAKTNGTSSNILFPGTSYSGIFIGYQEITDYVKAHGPGAYTVADVALTEGTNANPGFSGGWSMVVIYENPLMKSRAVTLFDGYAYVNGQRAASGSYTTQGEYGTIPISGFTTVGSGQVNMKLGVMAAEGDVATNSGSDYLAVQKLSADPTVYNTTNYLTMNHAGNSVDNFFNSSIYPVPAPGTSNPILQNNTGVDFSMFTIPNTSNLVIGKNQTSTTFRFGSTYEVYTIFGFAMSVDAYIPEPKGLISVNSINNVTNPPTLNALPGQTINYSLNITNEGTEATNNTVVSIPIPATAIFNTGATIVYHTYNGFTTTNTPYFDAVTNKIIWNLGTLPITSGHPEYIFADLSFTLNVTTDCNIILSAGCSPEVSLETGTIMGNGATSGSSFTKYFFQGYDSNSCHLPIEGSIKVAIDASSCLSSMAGPNQITSCGGEFVTLAASTGKTGTWSIISGPAGGGELFSNNTSPNSTFYSPNLGAYILRWTTSCSTTDDVVVTFTLCNVVNFDGIDDHINFKNNYNLNSGNFSIEAWIKSNASNNNTQTIISKRLNTSSPDGYDLRLVNNIVSFNWNNNSINATHAIDTNRWYHIGVTFDGTNYKLYIDGLLEKTGSGVNPTSNNIDCVLGAMAQNSTTPNNYFNGYIDEVRIWNASLTISQIRQMMNQEIINDGSGNIRGAIVPKNITGINWTNLSGYFQMNRTSDILNGYLVDKSGNTKNGKLKGIYVQEPDTAPIPYTSGANGNWESDATWTYFQVWDVPNSLGIDGTTKIDWNIVKTAHNITSNSNKIVLGLVVNSNILTAVSDSKIEVSSYLKLDGKIDLVGKSQLVQTIDSDLDLSSAGSIERDQQGQSNKYNYNYWSAPVSPINTTANNIDYTVTSIMKDGTASVPQNINWVSGYDGSSGSPINLARYWIYKFDNSANTYANWSQIGETGALRVGQGFTLKGSGAASGTQNYTFVGKPNNGTIATNNVSADQLLLTGNPYPSALDANAFINDNLSSMDGTLYFWEQYTTNDTHILRDYQGGYAERNLTGGVPATSSGIDFISGLGSSTKGIPNQFIPVGQSFFVYGNINSGGPITYKNTQRGFHKEDEVGVSNIMFKSTAKDKKDNVWNNNNDIIKKDTYKRIRIGYNSNNNYHRQVLIGFMDEKATSDIDNGYDGFNFDDFPNDMYFMNGEDQLVIQGVGYFDRNESYPIGIKADTDGKVKFMIDGLENFDKNEKIFIYDSENDSYNDIRKKQYEVLIPSGENNDRFSLCFKQKTKKEKEESKDEKDKKNKKSDDIKVTNLQGKNAIMINNKSAITNLQKVILYNMNGQSIATWEIESQSQQNIQLPIKNLSSGIYIVRIQTTSGDISKKIIVP